MNIEPKARKAITEFLELKLSERTFEESPVGKVLSALDKATQESQVLLNAVIKRLEPLSDHSLLEEGVDEDYPEAAFSIQAELDNRILRARERVVTLNSRLKALHEALIV